MLKQTCDLHKNVILAVCLSKGCNQFVLCRKCMREHPEDHDSSIKELELMENDKWLEVYEKKRDDLILQGKSLYSEKDKILNASKSLFNMKVQDNIKRLQDHAKKCLEEFDQLAVENSILSLNDDIDKLGKINFREVQNLFERIKTVKTFIEEIVPNTEKLFDSTQATLQSWKLDEEKINIYQERHIESMCSFNLMDFFTLSKEKSNKLPDSFVALKEENERLDSDLKKSTEVIEKLKVKELKQTQTIEKYNLNLASLTRKNNELQNKIVGLEQKVESYSSPLESLLEALSNKSGTPCGVILNVGDNYSWYFCKGRRNNCNSHGKIWGSNPYTDDSDLCKAAYHCGVISGYGGFALVKYSDVKLPYFEGSCCNGIRTSPYSQPFKPVWFILDKEEKTL